MRLLRFIFTLLFLLVIAFSVSAQRFRGESEREGNPEGENVAADKDKDAHSPDSVFVSYFMLNEQAAYTKYVVSKPLLKFQEYDIAKQFNQLYANLGSSGSASSPLIFSFNSSPNFRFRSDVFEPYRLNDDSIKFYISESPFSHLRYHMGPSKEQKLDITFSQRIGSGIYLGLNARFANNPGIYMRQRAFHAGATLYGAFLHPSKRYGAFLTFRNDRSINYENGGLNDVDKFFNSSESNRKLFTINLSEAENREKTNSVVFQQYFNILKPSVIYKTDSTTIYVPRKFDAGRFIHTFRYTKIGNAYEDNSRNVNFYPEYFNDTITVFDSTRHIHFENCLVYSNEVPDTLGKSFPLQYSFGIRFQTDRLNRDTIVNNLYTQSVPFGMLKGIIKQKTFFKASAFLVLGGYKSGDYSLKGNFYQFFGKNNHKAYLQVEKGLMHPDFYLNNYINDNFKWENSFGAQDYIKGEFGIILKGFDLKVSFNRITNYVYLNEKVVPQQFTGALTIYSGHINKEIRIRHWITSIYAATQHVTPDDVLQLPAALGKLTVVYDVVLFKKALHAQIGMSGTYHSKWYQDAYMPSIRAFYRQNNFVSGNYPYLDVFLNLNIKRARLFVKYEHFNSLLKNYSYILVPGYPQNDAALKFGISWLFFD